MSQAESTNEEIILREKYPACYQLLAGSNWFYNEGTTLAEVVKNKLLNVPCLFIIIVDDCSTDATDAVALELAHKHSQVRCVRHQKTPAKLPHSRPALR